jgi:glutamate carboxypeptidase
MSRLARLPLACVAACTLALSALPSQAEPVARIHELAQQEKAPLLDTLRDLVNIESGSKDAEGLARLAALIGERLTRLGGKVEIVEPTDIYRMDDTPEKPGAMVHAVFKGTGTRRIMLIAHMDTVYLPGMLKDQPFRIDSERAYGLAIADDKQGVALILTRWRCCKP